LHGGVPINGQLTIHHPLRGGGVAVADDFNTALALIVDSSAKGRKSAYWQAFTGKNCRKNDT